MFLWPSNQKSSKRRNKASMTHSNYYPRWLYTMFYNSEKSLLRRYYVQCGWIWEKKDRNSNYGCLNCYGIRTNRSFIVTRVMNLTPSNCCQVWHSTAQSSPGVFVNSCELWSNGIWIMLLLEIIFSNNQWCLNCVWVYGLTG